MIELPKPSGEEIVYRVVAKFCTICLVALVVLFIIYLVLTRMGILTASQSDGLSILLFSFFFFLVVACFSERRHKIYEQRRRDESASILFNAAKAGERVQCAFFMRPFYTTNRIRAEVPTRVLTSYAYPDSYTRS